MNSYIDLHCDTITMMHYPKENLEHNKRMVDISGMQKGGTLVQSFSAFVPTGYYPKPFRNFLAWKRFGHIADKKDRLLRLHEKDLFPVLSAEDIERCKAEGRIGALFTIEDAGVIGSKVEHLEEAYRRGVRIASLIWNHENTLGFPNSPKEEIMQRGLKPFGVEAVQKMNELGIVVDVSHLSDGGFRDVAKISKKPFIATHSNSRAMTNHPRNMSDEMIRTLAEKGGVMGLNFAPAFLMEQGRESRIEDMVRHVLHIRNVGGRGVLALGSDFDGISGKLEVDTPAKMPLLADALQKAGLTESEMEDMWYKNICRVFHDVWTDQCNG